MSSALLFDATITLGFLLSALVSFFRQRTFFTLSILFSLIWILVLIGHKFVISIEQQDRVSNESYQFLSLFLQVLFAGLILGQLFSPARRKTFDQAAPWAGEFPLFIKRINPYVLAVIFLSGATAFVGAGANFSFSFDFLNDARSAHVQGTNQSIALRLSVYASLLATTYAITMATCDIQVRRVNVWRIIALFIAVLPLALTTAGRIHLVTPIIHYLFALWFLLQFHHFSKDKIKQKTRFIARSIRKILPILIIVAIAFSVFGDIRSKGKTAIDNGNFIERSIYPIAAYTQSSLISSWQLSNWIDSNTRLENGRGYFEVFYRLPQLYNLADDVNVKGTVRNEYSNLGWIVYSPGTGARSLVSDFGLGALPYVAFMIALLSSLAFHKLNPINIPFLILLVLLTKDLAFSFHKMALFSTANMWMVIIAVLIGGFYRQFRKNRFKRLDGLKKLHSHPQDRISR